VPALQRQLRDFGLHMHYTPTSSSWLNVVERWFKELNDERLHRGAFTSVTDLADPPRY
jgi:transposase